MLLDENAVDEGGFAVVDVDADERLGGFDENAADADLAEGADDDYYYLVAASGGSFGLTSVAGVAVAVAVGVGVELKKSAEVAEPLRRNRPDSC